LPPLRCKQPKEFLFVNCEFSHPIFECDQKVLPFGSGLATLKLSAGDLLAPKDLVFGIPLCSAGRVADLPRRKSTEC
jgi:hypothetical protein